MSTELKTFSCPKCGSSKIDANKLECEHCGARFFMNVLTPALELKDGTDIRVGLPTDRNQILDRLILTKLQVAAQDRHLDFEPALVSSKPSRIEFKVRLPHENKWQTIAHLGRDEDDSGRYDFTVLSPWGPYYDRDRYLWIESARGLKIGKTFYELSGSDFHESVSYRGEEELAACEEINYLVNWVMKSIDEQIEAAKPKPEPVPQPGFWQRLFGSAPATA